MGPRVGQGKRSWVCRLIKSSGNSTSSRLIRNGRSTPRTGPGASSPKRRRPGLPRRGGPVPARVAEPAGGNRGGPVTDWAAPDRDTLRRIIFPLQLRRSARRSTKRPRGILSLSAGPGHPLSSRLRHPALRRRRRRSDRAFARLARPHLGEDIAVVSIDPPPVRQISAVGDAAPTPAPRSKP